VLAFLSDGNAAANGVRAGVFPPLIFLGIGAMTDFSALLSNPKSLLLGAAAQVGIFLTKQSVLIFALGCVAFGTATAGGVVFAKVMNLFAKKKVNPLIGAAGVSAVPESARTRLRRDVEHIREGEYEGFAAKMTDPLWKPDFGPDVFPPDKGATIIGARLPIVNFKAYLTTPNEQAAEWVAGALSGPASGLAGVHFYPALDRTRNEALLNITVGNFHATPLYRILEAVKTELRRFGAGVSRVEMVGLVPQRAMLESAEHYLQVFGFSADDVLENRLEAILGARD
jgi:hypothetical protein